MTTTDLTKVHTTAWDNLHLAATAPDNALHYLTLSTVALQEPINENKTSQQADPQARLLVLRKTDSQNQHLEFHTDTRSPKWRELQANPAASITGYDPVQRLQIRMQGTITLLDPQNAENKAAWSALSAWTKYTYCANAPGTPVSKTTTHPTTVTNADVAHGQERFGVLLFKAHSLDWFQLERGNNQRALFHYTENSNELTGRWITP